MYKVRISSRVISDLEGSQAWYETKKADSTEEPDTLSLMRKVQEARKIKDGSCTVELTREELLALRDRADWLADKSRDGMSSGEKDSLADYNAGAALLRQIDKVRS